jgi:hypothetical protein
MGRRTLAVGALGLGFAVAAWALWPREAGDDVPAPAVAALSEPEQEPEAPPIAAPPSCLDGTQRTEFVRLLRRYLDLESEKAFANRLDLKLRVKSLREAGCDPFRDVAGLTRMLYEARPFDPPFEPSSESERAGFHLDAGTGVTSVKDDARWFSFRLPSTYPKDSKTLNAQAPYPMIVTLHEVEDAEKEHPGAAVIGRRYPRGTQSAVLDEFIVFAPVAQGAKFAVEGAIDASKLPLNAMWQRYHVDFDRIVIDGGSDALLFAAAHAVFYAGVIVRGDAADVDPAIVKNFAHRKIYVVGTHASAARKSLIAGMMPTENVTVGKEDGIHAWVRGLERAPPRKFAWVVRDKSAHRFAHWVNLDEVDPRVREPEMEVAVVPAEAGSQVRITSWGVRGLSLFLNDRLVDLERPVGVVVNGTPVKEAKVLTGLPAGKRVDLPAKLDRDMDVALDHSPELSVRRSRYYSFLHPVVLEVPVASDAARDGSVVEVGDRPARAAQPAGR